MVQEQLTTPILLIFFNRPETFIKVFEMVRKVKPKKLYLAQDGPREGNYIDRDRVEQCRKIAENIDWDCQVYKNYSEKNMGCGMRPQSAISWVFKQEEKAIILEDDCIPSRSFFIYCEELLNRYKDDERICLISGLNHFEKWDTLHQSNADYFFCKTGAIWGWATWARAWKYYSYDLMEYSMQDIDIISKQIGNKNVAIKRKAIWKDTIKKLSNNENISYWDHQWGLVRYSQSQYTIVPKKNLITNIGVGEYSTHAKACLENTFKRFENFVFIPSYELEFPLKHPTILVNETMYDEYVYRINYPSICRKYYHLIKNHIGNRKDK